MHLNSSDEMSKHSLRSGFQNSFFRYSFMNLFRKSVVNLFRNFLLILPQLCTGIKLGISLKILPEIQRGSHRNELEVLQDFFFLNFLFRLGFVNASRDSIFQRFLQLYLLGYKNSTRIFFSSLTVDYKNSKRLPSEIP